MSLLKLVGVQCDIQLMDVDANVQTIERFVNQTQEHDPFLVVFPECSLQGYCFESLDQAKQAALPIDSSPIEQIRKLAGQQSTHIVFGFLQLLDDQVFNACVMATADGQLHVYHKMHLPKLGVDQFTTPGNTLAPVTVDGVKIGMNVCYDCSFPEPARLLALQDADIIVLPTNWPPGAASTADCIPNARALENNIYYMAINRVGTERGFDFIGKSKICHPEGNDLAFANHRDEAILVATMDPQVARNKHLVRVPEKHEIHRFADRRPEYYDSIARPLKQERK